MGDAEEVAAAWRDREIGEKFVKNIGADDRITVETRIDSDTRAVEETYTWHRPRAEPTPIFMSGDCAAIKQAIGSGLLEPTGEATYKRSGVIPNRAPGAH